MSFSADVKIELSKINNLKNKQEVYAEFLGYFVSSNIQIKKNVIKFSTSNEYNINRFAKLLNNININDYKINIVGRNYSVKFKTEENFTVNNEILREENIKRAFIRGCFLGAGSINNPRNKYHLEIIFRNEDFTKLAQDIIQSFGINIKILENTLYMKDGEKISNFLALIGASSAVLKFEEIRVIRDTKNKVNRLVNCETANLNKTISASVKQIEDIKKMKQTDKFNKMSEDLKEIAELRLKNPDATLEELGQMLTKPIGKSTVNHRFKKISEIANS